MPPAEQFDSSKFTYCIDLIGLPLEGNLGLDQTVRWFNNLYEAEERATKLSIDLNPLDWCVLKNQGDGTFDCCCGEWNKLTGGSSSI